MPRLWKALRRIVQRDPLRDMIKEGLVVGRNFYKSRDAIIDRRVCWLIEIGDDVTLAPRAHILAHDASTHAYLAFTRIGRVTIGNRVFIGAAAVVLPGVSIGDDVIVGAGSVVTRDVPAGRVVAGNPARVIGTTEEFVARRRLEMSASPRFGNEYRMKMHVTDAMKREMKERLKGGRGYLV